MSMQKIVQDLGQLALEVEAENGAPLPQYQPATPKGKQGYNHLIDAMNRLPRPLMALLTLAIFVGAGLNPAWFEARMQALSAVPDPMWWIIGAVITFFFGARETHYMRSTPEQSNKGNAQ
jgi:hypothetical protein